MLAGKERRKRWCRRRKDSGLRHLISTAFNEFKRLVQACKLPRDASFDVYALNICENPSQELMGCCYMSICPSRVCPWRGSKPPEETASRGDGRNLFTPRNYAFLWRLKASASNLCQEHILPTTGILQPRRWNTDQGHGSRYRWHPNG